MAHPELQRRKELPGTRVLGGFRTYMATMYRSAPFGLFKHYQHGLRQLFSRVRFQVAGGLRCKAVGFGCVKLGKGRYFLLAGCWVKRKLAPVP